VSFFRIALLKMVGTAGFCVRWLLVLMFSWLIPSYLRLYTYMDMILPYLSAPPNTTHEVER
jgi:hypothetical protein